jgi:hypothetical protein
MVLRGDADMRRNLLLPTALALASIAIGVAPLAASAAGLDGSANLVCAATRVVACTKTATCFEGDARTFELAEFIFVDFKGKVVKARSQGDAKKEESPIRILEKSNTQLIVQGVENGHGWGMSIDQAGEAVEGGEAPGTRQARLRWLHHAAGIQGSQKSDSGEQLV